MKKNNIKNKKNNNITLPEVALETEIYDDEIGVRVRDQLWDPMRNQVWREVGNEVWREVQREVRSNLHRKAQELGYPMK